MLAAVIVAFLIITALLYVVCENERDRREFSEIVTRPRTSPVDLAQAMYEMEHEDRGVILTPGYRYRDGVIIKDDTPEPPELW